MQIKQPYLIQIELNLNNNQPIRGAYPLKDQGLIQLMQPNNYQYEIHLLHLGYMSHFDEDLASLQCDKLE